MAKDNSTLIIVAAISGIGFAWWKGYLAQFGIPGPSSAPAAGPVNTGGGTGPAAPPAPLQPPTPPAPGTIVGQGGVLLQAAAKDPFILPDAATFAMYTVTPLAGYSAFSLTDAPNILLRQDVFDAANAQVGASGNPLSLQNLKDLMKGKGLSGLGDFRRHVFTRTGRVA